MNITEFLLARITEDEAVAKNAKPEDWWWDGAYANTDNPFEAFPVHHNPARVLAECKSKRAIVELCAYYLYPPIGVRKIKDSEFIRWGDPILSNLAAVYKDHPDYQQEWA